MSNGLLNVRIVSHGRAIVMDSSEDHVLLVFRQNTAISVDLLKTRRYLTTEQGDMQLSNGHWLVFRQKIYHFSRALIHSDSEASQSMSAPVRLCRQ